MDSKTPKNYINLLRQILTERFDEEELRTLCFELSIDYDSLRGEGKAGKARELVGHLDRRELIPKLIGVGERLRPDIPWGNLHISRIQVSKAKDAIDSPEDVLPRDGRVSPVARRHFLQTVETDSCVYLLVRSFSDLDSERVEQIVAQSPYTIFEDVAAGSSHFILVGSRGGDGLGEIVNQLAAAGVYHRDYFATLFDLVSVEQMDFQGDPSFLLPPYSEFVRLAPYEGHFYIRVPVTRE